MIKKSLVETAKISAEEVKKSISQGLIFSVKVEKDEEGHKVAVSLRTENLSVALPSPVYASAFSALLAHEAISGFRAHADPFLDMAFIKKCDKAQKALNEEFSYMLESSYKESFLDILSGMYVWLYLGKKAVPQKKDTYPSRIINEFLLKTENLCSSAFDCFKCEDISNRQKLVIINEASEGIFKVNSADCRAVYTAINGGVRGDKKERLLVQKFSPENVVAVYVMEIVNLYNAKKLIFPKQEDSNEQK